MITDRERAALAQSITRPAFRVGDWVQTDHGVALVTGMHVILGQSLLKYLIQYVSGPDSELTEEFGFWVEESDITSLYRIH